MTISSAGVARILLLSGASLVGQNILAALSGRRETIRLAATNSVVDEPSLFDFDAAYLAPPIHADPEGFETRFTEVLAQYDPDLVVPCRDDDVAFLAGRVARQPRWRGRFLCGSHEVARAMLDKAESWTFSRVHGLPFAPTLDADASPDAVRRFARDQGFPIIAKPRQGFASRGVRLVLSERQLEQVCKRRGYILQRYLGNPEMVRAHAEGSASEGVPLFHTFEEVKQSIQACIAPDGHITGLFATRNTMRLGRSERVDLDDDSEIAALGREWSEIFSRAGWRRPLNIQCQRAPEGAIMIYEYNGRFTGATAARHLLGFDEVGMVIREWTGRRLPEPAPPAGARTVVCLPVGRVLDPGKAAQLSREGCWEAPGFRSQK